MSTPVTVTQYGSYIDLQKHLSVSAPATSGSIYLSGSDAAEKMYVSSDISVPGLLLTGSTGMALGSVTVDLILDEDGMGTDSATALCTQQSIKAYVDSSVSSYDLDGITDGTGITIADSDMMLVSDAGTEKKVNASQVAAYVYGETAAALTVTGLATFNGNVDLGDATGDTITATGRFDSDLVPSTDSARDLGTSALQWAEVHADAGHIDAMTVTGTSKLATVSGSSSAHFVGALTAGTLATSGSIVGKTTVSGSGAGTFGTLAARTLDIDSMAGNWTNASRTVADLGTVTTADINGGSLDGVTIGAASAAAGTFAAIVGTSLNLSEGNITNAGDINCDTISVDDAAVGLQIQFGGATTTNKITLTDNLAEALTIEQGGNDYLKFVTSNSGEYMSAGKEMAFSAGLSVGEDEAIVFGNDSSSPDSSFSVASSQLMISGGVNANVSIGLTGSVMVTAGLSVRGGHISGSGDIEGGDAEFRTLDIDSFSANWTNASRTVADLGTVTTVDINGGSLDGVTIGAASAAAGTFAAIVGTSLNVSDGNITNVGDINCDSVSVDAAAAGLSIDGSGANTATFLIKMGDSLASALDITEGSNSYLKFLTNDEYMVAGKELATTAGLSVGSSGWLRFGDDASDADASLSVSSNYLILSGTSAGKGLAITGSLRFTSGSYMGIGYEDPQFAVHLPNTAGAAGRVKANAFVTYSDKRLKRDIRPIEGALDKVMRMEGVSYNWKTDGGASVGFIAQDLEKVVPEVVIYDASGGAGVDYAKLTSVLVEAVKAQQVELAELKKKLQ